LPIRRVRCGLSLDREVLRAESAERVVIKLSLDAPETPTSRNRAPVNVALVLDRSGSMSGDKIEKARRQQSTLCGSWDPRTCSRS